jgi:predicted dehydrogenase
MDRKNGKVRYAVVGLGYISQIAVLPAFAHARSNSTLTALVSGDPKKLKSLSRKYGTKHNYSYEQYADCLASGEVDAVYIALPNHMHRAYTEAAARAGIHVLCEKPMALEETDCQAMIAETGRAASIRPRNVVTDPAQAHAADEFFGIQQVKQVGASRNIEVHVFPANLAYES